MATSIRQDKEFGSLLVDYLRVDDVLQIAVDYIRNNMNPEDVFDEKDLKAWAEDSGYSEQE